MKRRSIFLMGIALFCVLGGVLSVSIYSNLKLQAFHTIQAKASELPFSWSQFESATKELLITYEMNTAQKRWLDSYQHFTDRFDNLMTTPFTQKLVVKDIDFQILVERVNLHWDIIQRKLKHTNLQLERYLKDERLFVENRDAGNILVNFGENWATGKYHNPLIDLIADLRKSTSRSDSLFSDELNSINNHIREEIQTQAGKFRTTAVLISALILGIAGIFVLYHLVGMAISREASQQYAIGLSSEIEERKYIEEKLRIEQRKLRVVLDAMGQGMYIVNRGFGLEYQNAIMEKDFGALVNQICHKKYFQSESPCPFCCIQETIESGKIRQTECALDDGRYYELIFSPFKDLDGEKKAIILWYDITEQKQIEAEAQRVAHLASIGELAAGVAHEINNPINGIISVAEIIKDLQEENAEYESLSTRIIDEGERVARIVKNLLYFSRNRSARHNPCYLENIICDTMGLAEKQLVKDGITVKVGSFSNLPRIFAQSQEIQQVFLNIISNARYALNQKHSGYHENKILNINGILTDGQDGEMVRVEFFDHGNGIPGHCLKKICDPFFSTKPRGEGTGLGLSISHGIMKSHGGRLVFESKIDTYTKVCVEFPVKV